MANFPTFDQIQKYVFTYTLKNGTASTCKLQFA